VKIQEGTDTKFGTCGKSPRYIAKCAYEAHVTALRVYSLPGYFTITLADDRNYLSVELTKQLQ
jgi:hypothetical protein